MAEQQPITITDSKERVAFELMNKIHNTTATTQDGKTKHYWLQLYHECFLAVHGSAPSQKQ